MLLRWSIFLMVLATLADPGVGNPAMPPQKALRGATYHLPPPPKKKSNESRARRLVNRRWMKRKGILALF